MATIAGPRPNYALQVRTFAAVTPVRSTKSLKRSPGKQGKKSASKAFPSLRDSYLAASLSADDVLHALNHSSQLIDVLDLDKSTAPVAHMAPFFNYKRLSSGPLSPAPINNATLINNSTSGQEVALKVNQSAIVTSPIASQTAACEKPLPPKPALRLQESPERRGVFDAQDVTANSLNDSYPPLEPAGSSDTNRSDQQSPAPSSFQIAPSLLSRNQSPNSVSTVEFGVAVSTTIKPVVTSHVTVETERPYVLKAPGSSKIPRLGSRLQSGQPTCGSPSRSPSLGNKVNRSMLRGRQALSVRSRQALSMTSTPRDSESPMQQEDGVANLPMYSTSGGTRQHPNLNISLEESATDEDTQRTSKYGYLIRESSEAREAIMGSVRSTITLPAHTPLHPPRTSSLPKTPSPRAAGPASNAKSLPTRPSFLDRQTAASSARASFNAKKFNQARASTSRIPQSRTLASLGDVGKGMRNFRKKVGKIIPHRRSFAIEAISNDTVKVASKQSHGPRRQASRLLTTYNNSGMDDNSEAVLHQSIKIADGFTQPEANDRHDSGETEKDKEAWHQASHNRAYDTETGRFVRFGQQDANNGDDEEDERPPSRRRNRVILGGHYVEDDVEQGGDNIADFADREEDENARDAELHPTRRGSLESGTNAVGVEANVALAVVGNNVPVHHTILDPNFDQMLTETDARSRRLLSFARDLTESPIRTLLIETGTHLAEGVIHTRQARIEIVRSNQALDEAIVVLATNTLSMSGLLDQVAARIAATRPT